MNFDEFEFGGVYLKDVLIVILIIVFAFILGRVLTLYSSKLLRKRLSMDHVKIINKSIYVIIFSIAAFVLFPIIGFDPSGIAVAGGIIGIILGLAAQGIVGNLLSGLFLVFERPIKVGDVVNIDSTIGQVEDIRIISTTIRTFDGYFVRIPNMTVFNSKIINYFINKVRRFDYNVGIRYTDDADKAVKIIRDTIESNPFALKYPEPAVFVNNLGDSSVNIKIKIWAPFTEWYEVRKDLLWRIKSQLEKNDIIIPFPQREVWFNNDLNIKDDK